MSFDGRENRVVVNRVVGVEENEVVGEVGGSYVEVGFRVDCLFVLKVFIFVVDDGEMGFEVGVEVSGVDKDINGIFVVIIVEVVFFGYSCDFIVDDFNIGFGERFEVVDIRSEMVVVDVLLWNEFFFEEFVVEFFFYLGEYIFVGIFVYLVVFKEDVELVV